MFGDISLNEILEVMINAKVNYAELLSGSDYGFRPDAEGNRGQLPRDGR